MGENRFAVIVAPLGKPNPLHEVIIKAASLSVGKPALSLFKKEVIFEDFVIAIKKEKDGGVRGEK